MDYIEFGEESLADLQSVADRLFANINDPTSAAYQRILIRPKIAWGKIVLALLLPVFISVFANFLMDFFGFGLILRWSVLVLLWCIYGLICMKPAVICLICIYQRYAPDSVRQSVDSSRAVRCI